MKTFSRVSLLAGIAITFLCSARAAAIDGKWATEFDSQIGQQKYTYDLKADGEKLTGIAHGERADGTKSDVAITEGKIAKGEVSFVEGLKMQDFDLRIEYTGKLDGDELKLTRKVGDFATEEIVAHRVKDVAAPDVKKATTRKNDATLPAHAG